ncbi:uncharacterized protein LOC141859082 isoform X3 [Acropora palmata]|uniref:uncharacterized protein LOC141859082 isoform X3 n=1 Tax=Acropora palmata TaxID=6131 RepID=UPI003DA03622
MTNQIYLFIVMSQYTNSHAETPFGIFSIYVILTISYLRAQTIETSSLPTDSSRPLFEQIEIFSSILTAYLNCENFLKDIAMDIFLKDMDTRSPLPLPNSYVEIGVWKQVMQINQHICGKMEQFTKMNQGSIDEREMVNIGEPSEIETAEKDRKSNEHHEGKSTFHDYYMEMITVNFGDDLDHLRKEGRLDSRKIEMLINCLETGKDIWSDLEKSLLQYEAK